jgi:hypothetical protein
MESITSIPDNRRNNNNTVNNNLTTSTDTDKSLLSLLPNSSSRDLSVGVVHYNMEAFGEN